MGKGGKGGMDWKDPNSCQSQSNQQSQHNWRNSHQKPWQQNWRNNSFDNRSDHRSGNNPSQSSTSGTNNMKNDTDDSDRVAAYAEEKKDDTKRGRSPRSSSSGKKKNKKRNKKSKSTSSSSSGTSEWIHTISKIKGRKKAIKESKDGKGDISIRVKSFLIPFKAVGETVPVSAKNTSADSDALKEIKEIFRKGAFLEDRVSMAALNTPEWTDIIITLARHADLKQLAGLNNIAHHGSKSEIVNRIFDHLQSEF